MIYHIVVVGKRKLPLSNLRGRAINTEADIIVFVIELLLFKKLSMGTTTQNGQVTQPGTKIRHCAENGAITQNNIYQVTQNMVLSRKNGIQTP